jgi:hypothetical protein
MAVLRGFFLLFFAAAFAFGQTEQQYPRGAILDEASYSALPRKAALATRAYDGLPRMFSLKQFSPLPGDQTDYGTCVAWASAYAARTISESVALNRLSQTNQPGMLFLRCMCTGISGPTIPNVRGAPRFTGPLI